jgi:hypothetical protein
LRAARPRRFHCSPGAPPCVFPDPPHDWLTTPEGALVVKKDPLEYLRKLRFHRQIASSVEYGLRRKDGVS